MRYEVFTIHGVLTKENSVNWQDRFRRYVDKSSIEFDVYNFKWGWSILLPFLSTFPIPIVSKWLRSTYAKKFKAFIKKHHKEGNSINLVAHSFGTYITHELILDPDVQLDCVILVAGVISSYLERNSLDEAVLHKNTKSIYVYSSKRDMVVFFAPPFFGHIGYWGLIDKERVEDKTHPRRQPYFYHPIFNVAFSDFDHNDYFVNEVYSEWLMNIRRYRRMPLL